MRRKRRVGEDIFGVENGEGKKCEVGGSGRVGAVQRKAEMVYIWKTRRNVTREEGKEEWKRTRNRRGRRVCFWGNGKHKCK